MVVRCLASSMKFYSHLNDVSIFPYNSTLSIATEKTRLLIGWEIIVCLSFCLLAIVSSVLRFTDYDTSLVSLNSSWPTLCLCPYSNLCSRVFETDMELIASRHGRDDLHVISLTIIYKCTASFWISYHCDDVIRLKLRTCTHQTIPRFGKLSYICL